MTTGPVAACALWDCGATGLPRIAVTFVFSLICTVSTAAMCLIRDDPAYLLPGLVLLAVTATSCDLAGTSAQQCW